MDNPPLRISTSESEGAFHSSKWLKHQLLISEEEMKDLFKEIGDCYICHASGPESKEKLFLSHEQFLKIYEDYVAAIKSKQSIDQRFYRRLFCNYLTYHLPCLYGIEVSGQRLIVKPSRPVVQMQFHHFFPSKVDGKFHSMVMTNDSVHWGVQFSYPQIFEDPHTHAHFKVNESEAFPNTALFKKIIKWMRVNTLPTPLIHQGIKKTVPFRLGRKSFSWINLHPDLQNHEIVVEIKEKEKGI